MKIKLEPSFILMVVVCYNFAPAWLYYMLLFPLILIVFIVLLRLTELLFIEIKERKRRKIERRRERR